MPVMSYLAFLQALGWAALNSIWQVGFLWFFLWITNHLAKLNPQKKYVLSVACIAASFLLFLFNISFYLQNSDNLNISVLKNSNVSLPPNWISAILSSASIAYLLLLAVPIFRFYESWLFIKELKRGALQKVNIENRLFVQKMAKHLGITRKVSLYFSDIIHSPVTIGFLKPIILLPIASLNHLTLQQAEAVLLHELAHIRRYDYLVNILISITSTILYFNPFVKLFVRMAEASREESCDELVLQFGYDKVSYATALLNLEKASGHRRVFAIAATGKSHLFQRIEKIAGLPTKRSSIKLSHLACFIGVIFFAFFVQVVFIKKDLKEENKPFVFSNFANPYYFIYNEEKIEDKTKDRQSFTKNLTVKTFVPTNKAVIANEPVLVEEVPMAQEAPQSRHIIPVALNEADAKLTNAEKKQVESTIVLVKEVLVTTEWKNLKKMIPDGLTEDEKNTAYREYLKEVGKINWKHLEQNLKAEYENINWKILDASLQRKLGQTLHDSSSDCANQKTALEAAQIAQEDNLNIILPNQEENLQDNILNKEKHTCKDALKITRKRVIKL